MQLAGAGQSVALRNQLGDRPFSIQNAFSLHFGRVRCQHRRNVRVLQHGRDIGRPHAARSQALEGHGERAFLQVTALLMGFAPAHVVAILGDIGQMREVAEGPHHRHRLVDGQVLEQAVQGTAGCRVALEAIGH